VAKTRVSFLCSACGSDQPKWLGRCPECGGWNTLERFVEPKGVGLAEALVPDADDSGARADEGREGGSPGGPGAGRRPSAPPRPIALHEVPADAAPRIPTGLAEFDRVLGGGVLPGSVILLGGEPGIGKSTLLLQALLSITSRDRTALYATSEESAQQLKLRSERLQPSAAQDPSRLLVHADSVLNRILEQAARLRPSLLAVDSIQLVARHDIAAPPGSITQLRRCCADLVSFAKRSGCAVIIVGHVTKEGLLSGPKMLEHLVDVVLSFEGDRHHLHRVVRATKNRFGSTQEVGLFEMTGQGLIEVDDSALALDASAAPRAGSILVPTLAGSRSMLAEIQALTASGFLGSAKRKTSGLDASRVGMLVAVLEKHAGLRLADQDIFVASAGGLRITEPAVDLGVALAIAGAHLRRATPALTAFVGEISLAGDLRPVRQIESRLEAARRRGVRTVVLPAAQAVEDPNLRIVPVKRISEAIEQLDASSPNS